MKEKGNTLRLNKVLFPLMVDMSMTFEESYMMTLFSGVAEILTQNQRLESIISALFTVHLQDERIFDILTLLKVEGCHLSHISLESASIFQWKQVRDAETLINIWSHGQWNMHLLRSSPS